jgi:4-alpha-glucanotransferase
MSNEQLELLAAEAGLSVDWKDANAKPQRVNPEVLRKVLGGLGYPADTDADVEAGLKRLRDESQSTTPPPLMTVDASKPLDLSRWFAPASPYTLRLEDGAQTEGELTGKGQLPGLEPVGYHQLEIEGQQLTVAVAPKTCYSLSMAGKKAVARDWGLTTQLYYLRREGDGGIGDTQGLEAFVRAAGTRGASAVAISPVHAMFSNDSERYSPYSPSSRLFLNPLYAAPGTILGDRAVEIALEKAGLADEFKRLQALPLIDWPAAASAKWKLLRELYAGFIGGDHPFHEDFNSFRRAGGEALENHCRFEALRDAGDELGIGGNWHEWPEAFKDPRNPALDTFAAQHSEQIGFHAFAQWLIARGLERAQTAARTSGMSVGLIGDLAVGADGAGSQAWSRQDELLSALTVGAPPDILNRAGQSWGISAFSPTGLKRNGFQAFIEMLRANFAHAGGLRIDHVMGLQRLWVIPMGSPPNEGAYLNYPLDDMLRLLSLESWRHEAIVLGEDLGTVPEGLHEKLSEREILGMRVLLFEQDDATFKPIMKWSKDALATTSTHDLPTLTGWLSELDIQWNKTLGFVDDETEQKMRDGRERERKGLIAALKQNYTMPDDSASAIIDHSIAYLGHTPAPLVLLPIEDALGIEEQANFPGTIDSHPNWRRRLNGDSGSLLDNADAARRLEILAAARQHAAERDQ